MCTYVHAHMPNQVGVREDVAMDYVYTTSHRPEMKCNKRLEGHSPQMLFWPKTICIIMVIYVCG